MEEAFFYECRAPSVRFDSELMSMKQMNETRLLNVKCDQGSCKHIPVMFLALREIFLHTPDASPWSMVLCCGVQWLKVFTHRSCRTNRGLPCSAFVCLTGWRLPFRPLQKMFEEKHISPYRTHILYTCKLFFFWLQCQCQHKTLKIVSPNVILCLYWFLFIVICISSYVPHVYILEW